MHADHEELARAELYGLLANLYQAPPPPALLKRIALQRALAEGGTGPTAESPKSAPSQLETRWTALVERAGTLPAAAIADEHEALFGGVGKPEIFLHASWFLAGFLNEKPLATLRGHLDRIGIERVPGTLETEDHFASLCEVMRYLITGDDPVNCTLATERGFFDAQLRPWTDRMCDAIEAHPRADFYRALAGLTRDFLAIEAQAFDLVDVGRH